MKKKIKYYDIIEVDVEISKLATQLIDQFNLSHGLLIPDAIIAASAVVHQIELFTYNIKDFQFIPEIKTLPYLKKAFTASDEDLYFS